MATRGVKGGGGSEVQLSHKSATVRFIMLAIMDMIMLAIVDMIMDQLTGGQVAIHECFAFCECSASIHFDLIGIFLSWAIQIYKLVTQENKNSI